MSEIEAFFQKYHYCHLDAEWIPWKIKEVYEKSTNKNDPLLKIFCYASLKNKEALEALTKDNEISKDFLYLAMIYYFLGDDVKAIDSFEKINTKNPLIYYFLGGCSSKTKDFNKSFKYYHLSADEGNNNYAQAALGYNYFYGIGVQKNIVLGLKYFHLSADQGNSTAQFNLGTIYFYGKEVEKNIILGLKYYKISADLGHPNAQFNLGCCYYNGDGIEKNLEIAVKYYKLSAEQGQSDALVNLGVCYCNGCGVEKNIDLAMRYYSEAFNRGNSNSLNNMLLLLQKNKDYIEVLSNKFKTN